jgi:hypothetical protein
MISKAFQGIPTPKRLKSKLSFTVFRLEELEPRDCPAGTWTWVGPTPANAGDGLWSNPFGQDWMHNNAMAAPNQYPGMAGSQNDIVLFNNQNCAKTVTVSANLLVQPLQSLQLTGWIGTLNLDSPVQVTGTTGSFSLTDGSTINIANNQSFGLVDLGTSLTPPNNYVTNGTITGNGNATFYVTGTYLNIQSIGLNLGINMVIQSSQGTGNVGAVSVSRMNNNIQLVGTNNYIDVGNGGYLSLTQIITGPGKIDDQGGIDLDTPHTGPLAVVIEKGGELDRSGTLPNPAYNRVQIQGVVYNKGGTVSLSGNGYLDIDGKDNNGYSYWQQASGAALLKIDSTSNINATGIYEIDTGIVKLAAPAGATADEVDGAGLVFGPGNVQLLIVDVVSGNPGTITVQGPVTLSATTTTTMNFSVANGAADRLDVQKGVLKLSGNLILKGDKKPGAALTFFDAFGKNSITGGFGKITDNVGGTNDTGQIIEFQNSSGQTEDDYNVTVT